MAIREATADEYSEILSILDAAVLQTDPESVRGAIEAGTVLVAVSTGEQSGNRAAGGTENSRGGDGTVLGALVLDGNEITAVAVRPNRRGQGIGSALVTGALESSGRLVAEFDPGVGPFWESLGFEISQLPDVDRFRGVRSVDADAERASDTERVADAE